MAPRLPQTELSFIGKIRVALLSAFTIIYTTISKFFKWGNTNGVDTRQIDKQSKQPREKERHYSPNGDIEPKVPVENDCLMENNGHKPQPKSLQCPGGSDSNTTTKKEETALKESTGSQSTTVYPSHGTEQNGGGNGGDSDPTKKTRLDENTGHYLGKGAVSLKAEGILFEFENYFVFNTISIVSRLTAAFLFAPSSLVPSWCLSFVYDASVPVHKYICTACSCVF